jgi:hypothetical protein
MFSTRTTKEQISPSLHSRLWLPSTWNSSLRKYEWLVMLTSTYQFMDFLLSPLYPLFVEQATLTSLSLTAPYDLS